MAVNNRTPNRNLPLPDPDNKMRSEDLPRLIEALTKIDADLAAAFSQIASKLGIDAQFGIADILGLSNALAARSLVGHSHALGALAGVDVEGAANGQFLKLIGSTWISASIATSDIRSGQFDPERMPSYLSITALSQTYASISALNAVSSLASSATLAAGSVDQKVDRSFQLLHVQDQKPSGSSGGTFTSGAWRTRDLNTIVTNTIPNAALSANQFELPAGTYDLEAVATAFCVGRHRLSVWNVSDNVLVAIGLNTSEGSISSVNGNEVPHTHARVTGRLSLTSAKKFELRHWGRATVATSGFGEPTSIGPYEVFAEVYARRIG